MEWVSGSGAGQLWEAEYVVNLHPFRVVVVGDGRPSIMVFI